MALGETPKAILSPISGSQRETMFDSSEFSAERILISASAVPHQGLVSMETRLAQQSVRQPTARASSHPVEWEGHLRDVCQFLASPDLPPNLTGF